MQFKAYVSVMGTSYIFVPEAPSRKSSYRFKLLHELGHVSFDGGRQWCDDFAFTWQTSLVVFFVIMPFLGPISDVWKFLFLVYAYALGRRIRPCPPDEALWKREMYADEFALKRISDRAEFYSLVMTLDTIWRAEMSQTST